MMACMVMRAWIFNCLIFLTEINQSKLINVLRDIHKQFLYEKKNFENERKYLIFILLILETVLMMR